MRRAQVQLGDDGVAAAMPTVQVETVTAPVMAPESMKAPLDMPLHPSLMSQTTRSDTMAPLTSPLMMAPVAAGMSTVQVEAVIAPVMTTALMPPSLLSETTQSDTMAPAMTTVMIAPMAANIVERFVHIKQHMTFRQLI